MLDDAAQQKLLATIDVALSKCIDGYNIASESGDKELAALVHERITDLRGLRDVVRIRPTRPARWLFARTPRGDARSR